jgi:hypothetical protein
MGESSTYLPVDVYNVHFHLGLLILPFKILLVTVLLLMGAAVVVVALCQERQTAPPAERYG